jgi:2-dehydropantoate 2-reductase
MDAKMANYQANPQQIAIVGQGAVGSLIGFKCHQLSYPYRHLLKTPHDQPLKITDISGQSQNVTSDYISLGKPLDFDVLIVPVKAYQVSVVLTQLAPLLQPKHVLVLMHNGMGTTEQTKKQFPDNPLVVATTSYGAYKPDAYSLVETGLGQTHLGWLSKVDKQLQQSIEPMLSALLPPSTWHDDINAALWNKLAINAVINPLTAMHNIQNGQLADKKHQVLITEICREISLVMNALQYNTSPQALVESVYQVISATANNYSSMHQDIALKRPTEIDFINGYVVAKGKALNIPTPRNQEMLKQVRQLENP